MPTLAPEVPSSSIVAQPGPQKRFVACAADIAGCGGSRGGGKTIGLLLDPLYDAHRPDFSAVLLRRTFPEIRQEGGLWDSSLAIKNQAGVRVPFYQSVGGRPHESTLEWNFPSGSSVRFAHMEHESDRLSWLGAQIPWIGFDQLETFSGRQFWDLLSCNRSMCGAHNRIRFSCNPAPDHFVRDLLRWWIDEESGLPILCRSGVIRWFARHGDEIVWDDHRSSLVRRLGPDCEPLSFTFFPSTVFDNPILLAGDPSYLAKLKMLPLVERERMLGGNWNVRDSAGTFFRREWFGIVDAAPACVEVVRYWDRAATAKELASERGSWTVGTKMGRTADGYFYVLDVVRFQGTPLEVMRTIRNTATQDGHNVRVVLEVEPGGGGKADAQAQVRNLAGFVVTLDKVSASKAARAGRVSPQVEQGNLKLVRASWNQTFINEHVNFDGLKSMADQVDTCSGAYIAMTGGKKAGTWGS